MFWNKVVILISFLFTAKENFNDVLLTFKVRFEEPLQIL